MKIITLLLLIASFASAGTVYLTPHGKTFHSSAKCMSLSRANKVLTADEAEAVKHGVKPCGICHRVKKSKPSNEAWAVKGGK